MKNADKPANPTPYMDQTANGGELYFSDTGLTKREMFAMHAMSSWIIHHGSANNYGFSEEDCAIASIACADALLAELEK